MKLIVLALAVASVGLSGCLTSSLTKKLTPEQAGRIAENLAARCGGKFKVSAGTDAGQLGGTARASLDLDVTCPTPKNPPPIVNGTIVGTADPIGDILANPSR